ncbi:MAG TPA: aldo/keto reductase [Ktedonobacteraceae bacterium]|nr:aldo/keto reductase [Ktedonobacteraceae bacterium]
MTAPVVPTARLGQTSLLIPRIGLGTAPLAAGTAYKAGAPVGQDQASAVIHTALSQGIWWFDTAAYYGGGLSETYLGNALAQIPRSSYMLSTKVGRLMTSDGGTSFDFTRDGILRTFEASLQRLQLDSIELLLLHDPDDHAREAFEVAFSTLADLRRQGIVKAIGVGMNQWRMLADFARVADPDCLLLAGQYTLLDQDALPEFLPLCQAKGISVLLAGVFNGGILAQGAVPGAYYKYAPASPALLARVRQMEEICARYQVPLSAAAIQFSLAHPAVTSVLLGAETPAEVTANQTALLTALPPALWEEFRQARVLPETVPIPRHSAF